MKFEAKSLFMMKKYDAKNRDFEKKKSNSKTVSVRLCNAALACIEKASPSPRRGFKGGAAQWIRELVYEKLNITNIDINKSSPKTANSPKAGKLDKKSNVDVPG
jgi:hypothetical protein